MAATAEHRPPRRRPSDAVDATGPGRRAGLDHDEVVARALAIVEEHGAAALSMRKLAADLGVTTTTVYWHVGSRDELVLAVIERVGQQIAAAPVAGSTPRARVASVAHAIWDSAVAHRNVAALAHQVGATAVLEQGMEVAMARELEAAGLRGTEVRDALRSILMCTAGFLVVALRRGHPEPAETWAPDRWSDGDAPLAADTLAALAEPADVDALFATTIAAVIAAHVPARAPRRPAAHRPAP